MVDGSTMYEMTSLLMRTVAYELKPTLRYIDAFIGSWVAKTLPNLFGLKKKKISNA